MSKNGSEYCKGRKTTAKEFNVLEQKATVNNNFRVNTHTEWERGRERESDTHAHAQKWKQDREKYEKIHIHKYST